VAGDRTILPTVGINTSGATTLMNQAYAGMRRATTGLADAVSAGGDLQQANAADKFNTEISSYRTYDELDTAMPDIMARLGTSYADKTKVLDHADSTLGKLETRDTKAREDATRELRNNAIKSMSLARDQGALPTTGDALGFMNKYVQDNGGTMDDMLQLNADTRSLYAFTPEQEAAAAQAEANARKKTGSDAYTEIFNEVTKRVLQEDKDGNPILDDIEATRLLGIANVPPEYAADYLQNLRDSTRITEARKIAAEKAAKLKTDVFSLDQNLQSDLWDTDTDRMAARKKQKLAFDLRDAGYPVGDIKFILDQGFNRWENYDVTRAEIQRAIKKMQPTKNAR